MGYVAAWDILGWDMSWCGLVLVWDNFGVGYVANGLVWDMLRCGLCRCGINPQDELYEQSSKVQVLQIWEEQVCLLHIVDILHLFQQCSIRHEHS